MQLIRVTAPDPILTVAEAKRHLRVEHDEHDALIDGFCQAVTENLDGPTGFLGRALGPQTWDLILDDVEFNQGRFCGRVPRRLDLPLAPLISVDEVEYRDSAGVLTPWTAYGAFGAGSVTGGSIRPDTDVAWPSLACAGDAFRVRFTCGYATSDNGSPPVTVEAVPQAIRIAALLHVGDLYKNRETVTQTAVAQVLPWAAEQLLRPYRFNLGLA